MPKADACLLDTNILLRMSKGDDPHYRVIGGALRALVTRGVRLCYTSQTLGEFWNASTSVIERDFEFLPDSQAVHDRWRRLLVEYEVKGVQVHDTRLAASMFVHGIPQLLTINVRDFARFVDLRILHPADVS